VTLSPDIPSHGKVNPLIWEVRKGFRRHLALSSPAYIKDALNLGYNAHGLILAAANGNSAAISQLNDLLKLQEQKRIISTAQPRPTPRERPRVWPYGEGKKIEEVRPRIKEDLGGSGKRKVPMPVIVATSALPFLRFRKPQSTYLTRIINDKIKVSKKQGQMMIRMQGEEETGEAENNWDSLLNNARRVPSLQTTEHPIDVAASDKVSWAQAPRKVLRRIQETRDRKIQDHVRRGDQMMMIVDEERRLRDAEKIESRRNKEVFKQLNPAAAGEMKKVRPDAIELATRAKKVETEKETIVLYKPMV